VDQAEYLVQFDEINDYLKDIPLERKMSYVRLAQVNSGTENEG
jgi:hypothetical protein